MFLSDYVEAIQKMIEICGNGVWYDVSCNFYGDFIFKTDIPDYYFIMSHKTHRIEKIYKDTWRNPEHKEVIYEGDFQNEPEN